MMIAEAEFLDKLLSGQVGFILATVLFGGFFWKVLLPRWDRQLEVQAQLADGVRIIAIELYNQAHKSGKEVLDGLEKFAKPKGHE
jgi:hypothetical protein